MVSSWKLLSLSLADTDLPPLLVKYDFSPSHYQILLTDLSSIWAESLERKQIVKRALNLDTSIDPSENNDQLQLLLCNIKKALDGEDATKISLSRGKNPSQFDLWTTTPLPGPLEPLQWPFYFNSTPQDTLAVELILPCLSRLTSAKNQIISLLQQVKEKDHIITRLTDKMQADGTDLSKVFPGAAGIKLGTRQNVREVAGRSVKGLKVFSEEQWRSELLKLPNLSFDLPDVLAQVFTPDSVETPPIKHRTRSETWWQNLKGHEEVESITPVFDISPHSLKSPLRSESRVANDGDFQRQTAPAHMRPSACDNDGKPPLHQVTQNSSLDDDDTTTDNSGDSDEEVPSKKAQEPSQSPSAKHSPALLSGSKVSLNGDMGFNVTHRTADVSGNPQLCRDATPSSSTSISDPNGDTLDQVISPKPKPRLGTIGGKAKRNKDDGIATQNSTIKHNSSHDSVEINTMKADMNDYHPSNPEFSKSSRTGQIAVQSILPSVPNETSQEKANNKRENLKRELESKTNAREKKKRKF